MISEPFKCRSLSAFDISDRISVPAHFFLLSFSNLPPIYISLSLFDSINNDTVINLEEARSLFFFFLCRSFVDFDVVAQSPRRDLRTEEGRKKDFQSESMDRRDGCASVRGAARSARCESQTPTKPTSILEGETGSRLEFRSGGEAYPLRRSQGDGDDDGAEVVVAYNRSGSTRIFPIKIFPLDRLIDRSIDRRDFQI